MTAHPNDARRLDTLRFVESRRGQAIFASNDGTPIAVSACGDALRLRIGPKTLPDYKLLANAEGEAVKVALAGEAAWRVSAGDLTLTIAAAPLRVSLARRGHELLPSITDEHLRGSTRLPAFGRLANGWTAAFALASGAAVYGLGEKFGPLDKRGQLIHSQVEDALGVNTGLSYKNTPFCWSPGSNGADGWGLFVNTPATVHWGIGHPDWSHRSLALICEDEALDLIFFGGTPRAMLASYTSLTGRPPELPLWGLGVWVSRAYYKTPQEAERVAARLRAEEIPCDLITLDGRAAWEVRTRFDFVWDPARFPDPPQQLAAIRRHGLRLSVWESPLVSIHSPRFAELADKGWLLKKDDGSAYVYQWDIAPGTSSVGNVQAPLAPSGLLDFTHPDAYAWWRDQHKALFDVGVDVITSDFGEQVPADCVAHNGDSGARLHNVYPLLYNQCVYDATQKFHRDGAMVWGRAGWTGAQRCPIQWGGDPQSDWEGLAASIRGGLSWGLSGVPFHASDIGGFYGSRPPDAELYVRWTQCSVFSSHLRFHGIGEREPWAYGADIKALVLRWLRLRYRLLPYLHALCTQASETGLPVLRALPLAFPDDARLRPFDTQFMCGDSLLIAPIIAPGGKVDIALPEGRWVDVRTGQWHDGGTRSSYHAALDDLPVFGRAGYVLPLGRIVDRADAIDRQRPLEELWLFGETQELAGEWRQCTLDTSKRKARLKINDRALKVRRFN